MYEPELNIDRLRQLAIDGAILLGLVASLIRNDVSPLNAVNGMAIANSKRKGMSTFIVPITPLSRFMMTGEDLSATEHG